MIRFMGSTTALSGGARHTLVLSGCVWLAAQCVCSADQTATSEASRRLRASLASESGGAKPVGSEVPSEPFRPPPESTTPDPGLVPDGEARIPYTPGRDSSQAAGKADGLGADAFRSVVTIGSSLAIVLGLFFVVVWALRRTVPGVSATLPGEVVEVLGRSVLAGREQLHLLRCGHKLLLVSVGQTSVTTLTEIAEPDEVNRLAGLCRQSQPGSTSAAFRQVFEQLAGPRTASAADGDERKNRGWEGRDV